MMGNLPHEMTVEADNGAEVLFVCSVESCGRRLVLKRGGELVVLDRGDFFVLHHGGTPGLKIGVSLP